MLSSTLRRTFLFLTNLAWENRVALPALIMVGCMVFNYRGEIEINIHTERIALHDLPNGVQGAADGAFGGLAIDHLEDDYSDEEDEYEYYDSDMSDDEEFDYEGEYQDIDDAAEETILLNRYAMVSHYYASRRQPEEQGDGQNC